jgi:uncharacterized alpha-E superfamily protein
MLARIAHELFWLGRNVVRAELTARMLDGVFGADLQAPSDDPASVAFGWGSILAIMGGPAGVGDARRDDVLVALTLDSEQPASIRSCVARAREQARTLRDVISAEMWEALNTTNLTLRDGDLDARLRSGPYSVYQYVRERSALFWGLTSRTMLRDEARAFLVVGGRMENADMVLRMLRVAMPPARSTGPEREPARDGTALALLQAVGGFQAFRRAVAGPPNAGPVARFLLYERSYPDSVAASLDQVHEALVAADHAPRNSSPVLRVSRLSADLEFRARGAGDPTDMAQTCEEVAAELGRLNADLAARYFAGMDPSTLASATASSL